MTAVDSSQRALNAVCPYFTMFPLDFPKLILDRYAREGQRVLDPFCGRGTTNFAARLCGLETLGIDSSPVATAITAAKLENANPNKVMREAKRILEVVPSARVPSGEFWELAYHPTVLHTLSRLRVGLIGDCSSSARRVLRGIILGALHGPRTTTDSSYFSNQCPRTYAPKPTYAVKYWRKHGQTPPCIDVLNVIRLRAERYLVSGLPKGRGISKLGDSRNPRVFASDFARRKFDWVITSPPYYGMKTYIPDQWLRYWFVGGPSAVSYSSDGQLGHASPESFMTQMSDVWRNVAEVCAGNARLVVRFGGISDRNVSALDLVKQSLSGGAWRIVTARRAGSAAAGKRQADSFLAKRITSVQEYDVWAVLR